MNEEQKNTLIKLVIYLVLFIIVAFVLVTNGNPQAIKHDSGDNIIEESKPAVVSYLDKQQRLLDGFNYTFIISGATDIKYTGTYKDNKYIGNKTKGDMVINYDEDMSNEDIFTGLNTMYFDFKELFNTLNKSNAIIKNIDNVKTYEYMLSDDVNIIIETDSEYINSIKIDTKDLKYDMEFKYEVLDEK